MIAIRNIVLTIAAGATMVGASNPLSALGLKVRGSNNVRARGKSSFPHLSACKSPDNYIDAALNAAFRGCSEALDHGAKPSIAHNHDGSVSFIHYPAVCETEAKAYKPTNGMTIAVSGGIITVTNAPADFLTALDA